MNNSERLVIYLDYYYEFFKNFLHPISIIDKMTCLSDQVINNIRRLPDEQEIQVEKFLSGLKQCNQPGALKMFLDAIKSTPDHEWLYPLLDESASSSNLEMYFNYVEILPELKNLLKLLQPQLVNIDVEDCIQVLSNEFSQGEKEYLLQKKQNYGNSYTLWWLITTLTRKEKGCILHFIEFLEERSYATNTSDGATIAELLKEVFDIGATNTAATENEYNDFVYPLSNEKKQLLNKVHSGEVLESDISKCFVESDSEAEKNSAAQQVSDSYYSKVASSDDPDSYVRPQNLIIPKKYKLRGYQIELVELAINGNNVIICAPPGSGKTIVAAHIIQHYLESCSDFEKSVLFFTPGSALAQQQCSRLQEYLSPDYTVDSCYGNTETSSLEMHDANVIVLTPQILLNSLMNNSEENLTKSVSQYGLLIFDECHHCMKGHPYNSVMKEYFSNKHKDSGNCLPQVIGLTATLGIGNKPSNAEKEILKLCSNLNAVDGIVTVQDPNNLEELYKHIPIPDEDITPLIDDRTNDHFGKKLVNDMQRIINILGNLGDYKLPPFKGMSSSFESFKQWCVNNKNEIAKYDTVDGRDAFSCIEYLEIYDESRDLHIKCRAIDAVRLLMKFKEGRNPEKFNRREIELYSLFVDSLFELQKLAQEENVNPNLLEIEKLILKKFKIEKNSSGMLMAKKRIYTKALKEWMNETDSLKFLNAEIFTGVGNKSNSKVSGIPHNQQQAIMKSFREKTHKILICTPEAAGEGLDVAHCNFVINYDYLKSDVALVQIGGRVRKSGGKVYQISSVKVAERDRFNWKKVEIMKKVTKKIQEYKTTDPNGYLKELVELQKDARRQDEIAMREKLSKRPSESRKEYFLQCRKCKMDVCSSLDLRILDNGLYTNATKEFRDKYITSGHQKKDSMGRDWIKKNKIWCKECSNDLGIEAIWKERITLPLVKIEGLRVLDKSEGNTRVYTPKKWKNSPFQPETADLNEIYERSFDSE